MKLKLPLTLFIVIIFCFASSVMFGVQLSKEIETKDGFSIFLPRNWVEIPQDKLDAYIREYKETATRRLSKEN